MEIEFVADAAEEQAREVDRGLDEYNAGFVADGSAAPVRAVFLESGRIVAGLNGVAYWRKVHVSILWGKRISPIWPYLARRRIAPRPHHIQNGIVPPLRPGPTRAK